MKFYLIAIIATFLVTANLQAQHSNIGIKGGLNLYNINNETSGNGNAKAGFHLGLVGHIHLNNRFAFQPEVVFSTQGSKLNTTGAEVNLNLNYVNVPLLLQYMFDNGFRIQAGPQLGLLASAKSNGNGGELNLKDEYKSTELGATFGISYVNPKSDFGIDARYNLGLSNIKENGPGAAYNRGYQLGVFYLFNHH